MNTTNILAEGLVPIVDEGPSEKLYRILVRDFMVMCNIGIYPREHLAPQRVLLNVDMAVKESLTSVNDDIANVLSYEGIIDGIKELIRERHYNLVENFADRIATLALGDNRVVKVMVRVEKMDIYPDIKSVGIEIERTREDRPLPETDPA